MLHSARRVESFFPPTHRSLALQGWLATPGDPAREAPLQLMPKGVRAPPKRQLQRWGEVAFAFH